MKWWNFRRTFLLFALCFSVTVGEAAERKSTATEKYESYSKNERTQIKVRNFWNRMVPRYIKVQYAGTIGFLSVGTGWDYGKNRQWETDVMLGYIPKYSTRRGKVSFTLKQNFIPWNSCIGNKRLTQFQPLRCGLFFNTVYGEEFWTREPSRYPSGYYNFSTRIRTGLFIGQSISRTVNGSRNRSYKRVSLYYELVSSDIYIISYFTNRYLKLQDILSLSIGIKWQIME